MCIRDSPELTAIRSSITASATEVSAALPLAPYLPRLLPFSEGAGISPSLGFGTLPLLAALSVPLHPGLTRRQRIVLPLAVATLVAWTCLPVSYTHLDVYKRQGREWDRYGASGPVAALERRVADLLGQPEAAFFPSGVMAQQAALRTWCDRMGSRRVAMPDLSHLLVHEEDGPRRLHGFAVEHLTTCLLYTSRCV